MWITKAIRKALSWSFYLFSYFWFEPCKRRKVSFSPICPTLICWILHECRLMASCIIDMVCHFDIYMFYKNNWFWYLAQLFQPCTTIWPHMQNRSPGCEALFGEEWCWLWEIQAWYAKRETEKKDGAHDRYILHFSWLSLMRFSFFWLWHFLGCVITTSCCKIFS